MPTKKSTKAKSRTSNKNTPQLTQFTFRWWMALVLVGVVTILGIIIIRFSHANSQYTGKIVSNYSGVITVQSYNMGMKSGQYTYKPLKVDALNTIIYQSTTTGECMYLSPNNGGVVGSLVQVVPSLCFK
ncbi:MAG: hypothetical protein U0516_03700 [Candidatus Saccharibacteria bacterium]